MAGERTVDLHASSTSARSTPHDHPRHPGLGRRPPRSTGPVTHRGASSSATTRARRPALRGFYLQDAAGDGDPATSDAIFVFDGGNADVVDLGDVVDGHRQRRRVPGPDPDLDRPATSPCCGTGDGRRRPTWRCRWPAPRRSSATRACSCGCRRRSTVTEHFQLGRFGQVARLLRRPPPAADQRRRAPAPAAARPAGGQQPQPDHRRRRDAGQNPDPIVFGRGGDPLSATNTLRGGDTVTGVVGVMTYTWGGNAASPNAYRRAPGQRARWRRATSRPPTRGPRRPARSAATSASRR